MIEWESVPNSGGGELLRASVPGGWLVRYDHAVDSQMTDHHGGYIPDYTSSIAFYPDPEHAWLADDGVAS